MNLAWKLPSEERLEDEIAKNAPADVFEFKDDFKFWLDVNPIDAGGIQKLLFRVGDTSGSGGSHGAPALDPDQVTELIGFLRHWRATRGSA